MLKRCKSCGREFRCHPQTPNQAYCSAPECQRERRRRWQQEKRRTDLDYHDNDARYNTQWAEAHPEYWKQYRENHPGYVERNRSLQQTRNQRQAEVGIANEDVSAPVIPFPSGRYRLVTVTPGEIAKGDEWIVEITALSYGCDDLDA